MTHSIFKSIKLINPATNFNQKVNVVIQNENIISKVAGNKSYYKKIIKPNAKELSDHREYLKSKLRNLRMNMV